MVFVAMGLGWEVGFFFFQFFDQKKGPIQYSIPIDCMIAAVVA